jgi:aspartyl-tRNA(Asn)/glutamyl-tRNA(Gln) amidotransferase subunit A
MLSMDEKKQATWSLPEASARLESGDISSRELTISCFKRIHKSDANIGAFLCLTEETALLAADASDRRRKAKETLGPLDGVPVAVKDMMLTEGIPTTAASKILEGFKPPCDATVVAKLKAAGAVMMGKLNQDEFAMGSSTELSAYKICKNPWDFSRTPGGSSGGSAAAVAAGFVFGTLGTDTGGSIRQPASFCGVAGIKPTYGRVSRQGVVAYASSLDQVGPFAKNVSGAAIMLQVIAGHDARDSTSVKQKVPNYLEDLTGDVKGLRVGIPREYFIGGLDAEVRASVHEATSALRTRGAEVKEVSLPHSEHAVATYYVIATAEAASNLSRYDGVRFGHRLGEKNGLLSMYEETRGRLFGSEVKRRIMLGTYVLSAGYYDAYYVQAQKVRRLFADDFKNVFQDVDVIVCPTTPTPAFGIGEKIEDHLQMYLNDIFTVSANLAGLPAMSLLTGFSEGGLPLGTQIIGRPFEESTLMNTAFAVEQTLNIRRFLDW